MEPDSDITPVVQDKYLKDLASPPGSPGITIRDQLFTVGSACDRLSAALAVLKETLVGHAQAGIGSPEKSAPDRLLAPKQVAELLNISMSLLEKWRREGKGPLWLKLEGQRAVRYRRSDVLRFMADRRVK